jgi:hypothetical protein
VADTLDDVLQRNTFELVRQFVNFERVERCFLQTESSLPRTEEPTRHIEIEIADCRQFDRIVGNSIEGTIAVFQRALLSLCSFRLPLLRITQEKIFLNKFDLRGTKNFTASTFSL